MVMVKVKELEFYMEEAEVNALDSLCYNAKKDFDFVVIVSGSGMVRVGKSVKAMLSAAYCSQKLGTSFTLDNICFNGKDLLQRAIAAPKNSVFVYDEAQLQLGARAAMANINREINDFFIECGQLNHIIFLVVPDFFALNKYIAVNRSIALIDVNITPEKVEGKDVMNFRRGRFRFFNSKQKRQLYNVGKKMFDNYYCVNPSFRGTFPNQYPIDEVGYRAKKLEYLKREREECKDNKWQMRLYGLIYGLTSRNIQNQNEISKLICEFSDYGITKNNISKYIKRFEEIRRG